MSTTTVDSIVLTVPGTPGSKGRPRFVRATGNTYTPDKTMAAEEAIRVTWELAGRRRMDDVPLELRWEAVFGRPVGHYLSDGSTLSSVGRRSSWPTRRPDVDNLLKLADALNGLAWKDDAQIAFAEVMKRWAERDEAPHTRITVSELAA